MTGQSHRLSPIVGGFIPLLVAAGVVFTLVVIGGKAVQGYELRQEAFAVEQRIDVLKRENRELLQQLDYYRSDQFIEKVAREELGLIMKGDVAVVMSLPEDYHAAPLPDPVLSSSLTDPVADNPTWQRWLRLFVGRD